LKWWKDVDSRIKPAYAAQQRILKRVGALGPGVKYFASQSSFVGSMLNDELDAALRMIPDD
ncbi:TPA: hypothetical protein ACISXD_004329, partial [Salmonella enterica subsp. diarizonae serovar 61:l,v:z35]